MNEYQLDLIPNYITASTPSGLRRLMFLTNIRLGVTVKFFDIQKEKGNWFAWYYEKAENKVLDGTT